MNDRQTFDPDCRRCPRLCGYLEQVQATYPEYHARPVAPFGQRAARLTIVGLAPGLHGANASGRPFTGDYAGILLYATLHKFGFSSHPESVSANDGLRLYDCRITNAVKCLPPQNKPAAVEINNCNRFLEAELGELRPGSVVLALGAIAHRAVLRALGARMADFPFTHGGLHQVPGDLWLLDSYHCSRYNTQTRRLTPGMFESVFESAARLLATH